MKNDWKPEWEVRQLDEEEAVAIVFKKPDPSKYYVTGRPRGKNGAATIAATTLDTELCYNGRRILVNILVFTSVNAGKTRNAESEVIDAF